MPFDSFLPPFAMQPNAPTPFAVGQIYNRRAEIHGVYGGQQQGGMSTPSQFPVVFLFTSDAGHVHGYRDAFREDGVFCYTGEGQQGDMTMTGSNRALRDHAALGKTVHLFEQSKTTGKGRARYVGQATYLGHHREERPNAAGVPRLAIVFELAVESVDSATPPVAPEAPVDAITAAQPINALSLAQLRQLAEQQATRDATPQQRVVLVRKRSQAIRAYVLKRANGTCEGCAQPAPFQTKANIPYLEPHHTLRLADGGPDAPAHVIALCPNCHRRAHYADNGREFNEALIAKLAVLEPH